MHEEDVLLVIRGYWLRMEQWDELFVKLATNIVATPRKSKRQLDVKKMRLLLLEEAPQENRLKDLDTAANFLAAVKAREKS